MLGHRQRRWANINPALVEHVLFDGRRVPVEALEQGESQVSGIMVHLAGSVRHPSITTRHGSSHTYRHQCHQLSERYTQKTRDAGPIRD